MLFDMDKPNHPRFVSETDAFTAHFLLSRYCTTFGGLDRILGSIICMGIKLP